MRRKQKVLNVFILFGLKTLKITDCAPPVASVEYCRMLGIVKMHNIYPWQA